MNTDMNQDMASNDDAVVSDEQNEEKDAEAQAEGTTAPEEGAAPAEDEVSE